MRFSTYRKTLLSLTGLSLAFYFGCGGGNSGDTAGSGGSAANGSGASGGSAASSAGGSSSGASGGTLNLGGSSGSSSTGGTGVIDPDAGCATSKLNGTLIPANLLFVVDRSGSMKCNLPQDGQTTANCEKFPKKLDPAKPSKWELTRAALESALSQLQQGGNVSAGLVVFPADGSNCTVNKTPNVPIASLDSTGGQVATISTFLDNETPGGSTPLAGADIEGYAYILSQWSKLPGNKFVVLLTDGFETCSPDSLPDLLTKEVPQATSIGIRTFVIGVPGSEDGRALLSQIAYIGGTPKSSSCTHNPSPANVGDCHFDMTTSSNFSQDLQDALKKISGTVLSCELDVPKNPSGGGVDPTKVNVTINGKVVNQDTSTTCDKADGWQYNSTKTKIELCGSACTNAKQPNATVQVVLGCPTGGIF